MSMRRLSAFLLLLVVFVGSGIPAASAAGASSDLVVNLATDKASYPTSATVTYTIEVTSRGPDAITSPATLTLNAPAVSGTSEAWETTATCVASGGAVCPATYQLDSTKATMTASIPALPALGKLVVTVTSPAAGPYASAAQETLTATIVTGATDLDPQLATNTATRTIDLLDPSTQWAVDVSGPTTSPGATTVHYTVTLTNDGLDPTAFVAKIDLTAGRGTGTVSPQPYLGSTGITAIACTATTGGASCADAVSFRGAFPTDQVSPTLFRLDSGTGFTPTRQSIGSTNLPGGSSITFDVTVAVDAALCSSGSPALRTLTMRASTSYLPLDALAPLVIAFESPYAPADDTDTVVTNVDAPACAVGDLRVTSITQPAPQLTNGLQALQPWSFTVEYTNAAGASASDVPLMFALGWPTTGVSTAPTAGTPVCVAAGGASCPTTWVTGTAAAITGTAPSLPVGGTLTVTYSGVGGGNSTLLCKPQAAVAVTTITPPAAFQDTQFNTTTPTWVNNKMTLTPQTDVGVACGQSHDDQVTVDGPYSDPGLTTPLVGAAAPGQAVYFKTTMTNLLSDPAYAFSTWSHSVWVNDQVSVATGWPAGGDWRSLVFQGFTTADPTDPAGRWRVTHNPGDSAGLPTVGMDLLGPNYPYDSGVSCRDAVNGATCPQGVDKAWNNGGGLHDGYYVFHTSGWSVNNQISAQWGGSAGPALPNTGALTFVTTYRVPPYSSQYTNGKCSPFLTSDVNWKIPVNAYVAGSTDPVTADRQLVNDTATTSFTVLVKACTDTLTIDKTVAYPATDADPETDTMGLDRKVSYDITVKNTSPHALDLPHLVDLPYPMPASSTITCDSETLGAACPTFTPSAGVAYRADGTTGPIDPDAVYDFVWGQAGAPTMPAGSSVTFHVTLQYPLTGAPPAPSNVATFTGDSASTTGLWVMVRDAVTLNVPYGATLALQKIVSPTQPKPGQTVTYTVDLINGYPEDAADVHFSDPVGPVLAPTNPAGFASLACRPLTEADGVLTLRGTQTMGAATCPDFVSDSTGITATMPLLPALSGLRLTYTAVAPLESASAENIASLTNSDILLTIGDAGAQANLSVLAITVSGTVWHDADNSAAGTFTNIRTGTETGTAAGGLTAVLVDTTTGTVLAVVPVADDGTYRFVGVPPQTDVTVSIVPTTAAPAVGDAAPTAAVTPGWLATTPLTQATFNTGTVDTTDKDFGVVQPATIGDYTWIDTDGDGIADPGESPLPGVKVTLTDSTGTVVASTVTDAMGHYLFNGLLPATYTVTFVGPDGYVATTSVTQVSTVAEAGQDLDRDAGFRVPAVPVTPEPEVELPQTGANVGPIVAGGVGLVALGGLVLFASRRRRTR